MVQKLQIMIGVENSAAKPSPTSLDVCQSLFRPMIACRTGSAKYDRIQELRSEANLAGFARAELLTPKRKPRDRPGIGLMEID